MIVVLAMCAPTAAGGQVTASAELVVETQDRIDDDGNLASAEDTDGDNTYASIQAAVDAAPNGALINVTTGVYNETVVIDKPNLVIIGDTGNSLPGAAGNAPLLDSSNTKTNAFKLLPSATNVVIEGFEIQEYTVSGVFPEVGSTQKIENLTVRDNTISDVAFGVALLNQDDDAVFEDMTVAKNEISNVQHGVNLIGNTGVSDIMDITVSENTIRNANRDGIQFLAGDGIAEIRDLEISDNTIESVDRQGIELVVDGDNGDSSITSAEITRNTVENTQSAIELQSLSGGDVSSVDVRHNELLNNDIGTLFNAGTSNDISIHYNAYEGNSDYAVDNTGADLLSAQNNWYGANSGPAVSSNPQGTGDAVSDSVDYDPFLNRTVETQDGTAPVGETVRVDVTADAADVAGYELALEWDGSVMNLTAVEGADFTSPTRSIDNPNGTATLTEARSDGVNEPVLATLVFNVTAPGQTDVSLDGAESALFDFTGEAIDSLAYDAGTVQNSVPGSGDANGDGQVNAGDVVLVQRYLVGDDVSIDLQAADVDGDGDVDAGDALAIKQQIVEG